MMEEINCADDDLADSFVFVDHANHPASAQGDDGVVGAFLVAETSLSQFALSASNTSAAALAPLRVAEPTSEIQQQHQRHHHHQQWLQSDDSSAEYADGLDLLEGRNGVAQDAVRARRMFEDAAGRGHARAQGLLGHMLLRGFGGLIDLREAARVL
jgi:TPR repeat protein